MQPHTAAVLNAFIYLLNHPEEKRVDVVVEYGRNRKSYTIQVDSKYGDSVTLRVMGFWTCGVTIKYQGHRAWTTHDNETQIRETFDFYPNAILNGQVENSKLYKWFKGDISEGGKRITFEGEYKGQPARYTTYIR